MTGGWRQIRRKARSGDSSFSPPTPSPNSPVFRSLIGMASPISVKNLRSSLLGIKIKESKDAWFLFLVRLLISTCILRGRQSWLDRPSSHQHRRHHRPQRRAKREKSKTSKGPWDFPAGVSLSSSNARTGPKPPDQPREARRREGRTEHFPGGGPEASPAPPGHGNGEGGHK